LVLLFWFYYFGSIILVLLFWFYYFGSIILVLSLFERCAA